MPFYGIYLRHLRPQFIEYDTLEEASKGIGHIEANGDGFAQCFISNSGIVHLIDHQLHDDIGIETIKSWVKNLGILVDSNLLEFAEPLKLED